MIGQVIGNYRIVSELGKGGMGMVYRAEHVQLGKPAALKMLLPQLSSDPSIVQRFFNEARAASAIDHPGIVEVFDFGTHTDGAAYIVMALLKGESLEQRLRRGPLPPLDGAMIVSQVLGALAAAHARGIVHRDLKPDNIFLTPNELMPGGIQIKLLDFGIAKLADDKQAGFKTQTGMMMGTPAYMSPEQCMGRSDLDHRTDLYAIGCILFHVLTGRPPFVSDQGTGMMIAMHIRDAPPHPRSIDPRIPDNLAAIVMRLLEKEPEARYQTAAEVRDALAAVGAGAPSRPPVSADQYAATMAPGMVTLDTMRPHAASAPTTASGSAAQVVPHPAVAPALSRAGLFALAGLVLAALGGVGVWAAMRGDDATPGAAPATAPAAPVVSAPPAPPAATPAAEPTTAAGAPVAELPPCPLGQVRGLDTHDHCCWPDQAWSSSKNRCVGTPRCPPAHEARGEECVVVIADATGREAKPAPPGAPAASRPPPHGVSQVPSPPPPPAGPVPRFTVASALVAGATFDIKFSGPVPSPSGSRSWITIVEAQRPSTQYGDWTYIADGATAAQLKAPAKPGAYEVRLHTDYPRMSTNVRHTVPVLVKDGPASPSATPRGEWRFLLASKVFDAGEKIEISFPTALRATPGEKFWITVIKAGAADSSYGTWSYVADGARSMLFEMPEEPGEYEIRLHANYPRLSTNVVHRARIRVER